MQIRTAYVLTILSTISMIQCESTTVASGQEIANVTLQQEQSNVQINNDKDEEELNIIEEDMQLEASIIPETSSVLSSSITADHRFQFVPMTLAAESSRIRSTPIPSKTPQVNHGRKKHKNIENDSNSNTVSIFKSFIISTLVFFLC